MKTTTLRLLFSAFAFLIGMLSPVHALTIPASEDTTGYLNRITSFASNSSNLQVDSSRVAFFYFNLDDIPEGSVVKMARLRFYVPSIKTKGAGLGIHRVTGQWNEAIPGVQPPYEAARVAEIEASKLGSRRFMSVDVTSLVQDWINFTAENEGFAVTALSTGSARISPASVIISAKEGPALGLPALLDIELENVGESDAPISFERLPESVQALVANSGSFTLQAVDQKLDPIRAFLSPQIIEQPSILTEGGILSVQAQGVGNLTYQWMRNGVALSGATASKLKSDYLQSGTYSVLINNGFNSVLSSNIPLTKRLRYMFVPGSFTWDEAKEDAQARGGHLVTITSAQELADVKQQLGEDFDRDLWLGASITSGRGWEWVTGGTINFNDFSPDSFSKEGDLLYPNRALRKWPSPKNNWDDAGPDYPYCSGYIIEFETNTDGTISNSEFSLVSAGYLPSSSALGAVSINTFFLGKTEVPWSTWKAVREWAINNNYISLAGVGQGIGEDYPVTSVNWYDALKWCNARSEMEGKTPVYTVNGSVYRTGDSVPDVNETADGYRLPSEAEWEFAARGGARSKGYTYSGANNLNSVGWHDGNSGGITHATGLKLPNEIGIYDMSGNVWEWCFTPRYTNVGPRAIRGGGVLNEQNHGSVGYSADYNDPWNSFGDGGFRVAMNVPPVLHFARSTDAVKIAGSTLLNQEATFEAFIMLTSESDVILGLYSEDWAGQGSPAQKNLLASSVGIGGFAAPNSNFAGGGLVDDTRITLNKWHHFAFVANSTHERLYLDGKLVKERASSGQDIWESNTSCFLGGGFIGYLSSFKISNKAKYSGAEYTVPTLKMKSETDTVLLYNFNKVENGNVVDESGNGRTGTIGGTDFHVPNPTAPDVVPTPSLQ